MATITTAHPARGAGRTGLKQMMRVLESVELVALRFRVPGAAARSAGHRARLEIEGLVETIPGE